MSMTQVDLESPNDTLTLLRAVAEERRSGELLIQHGDAQAKIYFQQGVILWAFATGQRESFQSILLRESHISKERLVEGIRNSREAGKRGLDEILLGLGINDRKTRHDIVLRHTRAAIQAIVNWDKSSAQLLPRTYVTQSASDQIAFDVDSVLHGVIAESKPSPAVLSPQGQQRRAPTPPVQAAVIRSPREALEHLRVEIPNFLAAMVIDGKTGMPIEALSEFPDYDMEVVSAFYKNLMQSADDALLAIGRETDETQGLEEIMITCREDYALMRLLKPSGHILYVLVDAQGNPAHARIIVKRYVDQINAMLG